MPELQDDGTDLVSRQNELLARSAVARLLSTYIAPPDTDIRDVARSPFFAPVSLILEGDAFMRYSAFAHDISPFGIGLLHLMSIQPGEIVVVISRPGGGTLSLRTHIGWCLSYGEIWYRSGGRFLQAIEA